MSRYNPQNRLASQVTTSPPFGSTTTRCAIITNPIIGDIAISYTGQPQFFSSWQLVGTGMTFISGNSTSLNAVVRLTAPGDKTIICRLK